MTKTLGNVCGGGLHIESSPYGATQNDMGGVHLPHGWQHTINFLPRFYPLFDVFGSIGNTATNQISTQSMFPFQTIKQR